MPPYQPIKLGLPPRPEVEPPPAASPPPPKRGPREVDLDAQIAFGDSTVDEAGVLLAELSVLVYENLDRIHQALCAARLDRFTVFDADRDRETDLAWVRQRAARSLVEGIESLQRQQRLARWQAGIYAVMAKTASAKPEAKAIAELLLASVEKNLSALRTGPIGAPAPSPAPSLDGSLLEPARPPGTLLTDWLRHAAGPAADGDPAEAARRLRHPRVVAVRRGDAVVLAFRGTHGLMDWLGNFAAVPAWAWPLRHAGFHWRWRGVRQAVLRWLAGTEQQLGRKPTVYLGGHSLGGAMATLAALDLSGLGYPVARVVTLGAPRAGGWVLRKAYSETEAAPGGAGESRKLPAVTTRWVHGWDVVANVLPPPGITAHVVRPTPLTDAEGLHAAEYLATVFDIVNPPPQAAGLVFPAPVRSGAPVQQLPALGTHPLALGSPAHPVRQAQTWRRWVGGLAWLVAAWLPGEWWMGWLLRLAPLMAEATARGFSQHRSAKYLGFMPPTALGMGMSDAPRAPGNPGDASDTRGG